MRSKSPVFTNCSPKMSKPRVSASDSANATLITPYSSATSSNRHPSMRRNRANSAQIAMKSVIVAANAPIDVTMNDPGYCICARSDTATYRPYRRAAFIRCSCSTALRLKARHHTRHQHSANANQDDDPRRLPDESRQRCRCSEVPGVDPERRVEKTRERLQAQCGLQPFRVQWQRHEASR